VYAGTEEHPIWSLRLDDDVKRVTCGAKTTLCSAAVTSPATARLAYDSKLSMNDNLQLVAGLRADVQTLMTLRELGMPLSETVVKAVAESGRLDVLQHLLSDQQCPRPYDLGYYAARSGNINMLDWLRLQNWCEFDESTCAAAAQAGKLAALQRLINTGCDWSKHYTASSAASGGSVAVIEYLRQQPGVLIDANVMAMAARNGQTAMCQHLRCTGCEWNVRACSKAARGGHLDTLRWLRENECPWDARHVCIYAARYGHTNILNFVLEQGELVDVQLLRATLNAAGSCNQLQTVQWLRQHGADWPTVLQHDSRAWHGDTLRWARDEGCTSPISTNADEPDNYNNNDDFE
jgi:hypothetical protein